MFILVPSSGIGKIQHRFNLVSTKKQCRNVIMVAKTLQKCVDHTNSRHVWYFRTSPDTESMILKDFFPLVKVKNQNCYNSTRSFVCLLICIVLDTQKTTNTHSQQLVPEIF